MFTHPLARELEGWWKDHGGRHDDPQWQSYLASFQKYIGIKCAELSEEHENVGPDGQRVFGMSKAGGCTRAAALKMLGHESTPFTGSSLATFHIGHVLECMALATLEAAGYELDGTQVRTHIPELMSSTSDGAIAHYPYSHHRDTVLPGQNEWPLPCLLSIKTTGYKKSGKQRDKWVRQGFPALPFEGVRRGQPSWWAQAQAEMHGSGIGHCLVLVVAKDIVKAMEADPYLMGDEGNGSLTFYAELIQYDPMFCESELLPVWEAAKSSVLAGRAGQARYFRGDTVSYVSLPSLGDGTGWGGPNQGATGTFNPCYGCDFRDACKQELAREFRGAPAHAA